MEDDSIKHFEFQSTNEGLIGLKRFRMYEEGGGRVEGGMQMLISLVKDGILKIEEAAKRLNMTEADFEKRMKEE